MQYMDADGVVMTPSGWIVPDPGVPLSTVTGASTDPARIWRSQPSVRKVVGFAARSIAQLPWHVFGVSSDGVGRERLRDSPVAKLINEPAAFLGSYHLIEALVVDAMMYDKFAAVADGDRLLRILPRALEVIPSGVFGQRGRVRLLTPAGQPDVDLTDAPLVVGWGWSASGAAGLSPLVTLAEILEESRLAVEWRKRQWSEAPKFGGMLKHPTSFRNPEKRDRFMVSWKAWREGQEGTPLLEDGLDYIQAPTIKPSDARDIEGRQLTDAEVASAFGIPPELVGARPGNYSNMTAYRSMLYGPTLGPLIVMIEQAFNRGLVPLVDARPGVYVEAAREAAINGSLIEQAQTLQTMVGGPIMTRAEARARLNLPYLDGTDELIVPMNVTEGGQASPTDSGAQNRQLAMPGGGRVVHKARSGPDREAHVASLDAAIRMAYEEMDDAATGDLGDIDDFIDAWRGAVSDRILPGVKASAADAAHRVLKKFPVNGWDDKVMAGYLSAMADTTAGGIAAGAHAAMTEDRTTALSVLGAAASAWAASTVAEAMGFGGADAARAGGAATKTWIVTSSNPRVSHAAMNGETVALKDEFSNGARWPGDAALDVDEAAGCTCDVEYNSGGG